MANLLLVLAASILSQQVILPIPPVPPLSSPSSSPPSVAAKGDETDGSNNHSDEDSVPPPPQETRSSHCAKDTKAEGGGCNTLSRHATTVRRRLASSLDHRAPKEEVFEGKLMGVRALVVLMRAQKKALITLSGIPIGGKATGEAAFEDPSAHEQGGVVVSEPLAGVLRRRGVSIVDAAYDKASDTVKVAARLPIFGVCRIVLSRRPDL